MRVLELHAADEFRNLVPGSERGRPVGNGQAGVVAGDERSGNDQKKSPAGEHDREPMMPAIVGCRDGFQSSAPWVRKVTEAGIAPPLRRSGQSRLRTDVRTCSPSNPAFYQTRSTNRPLLGGCFEALIDRLGFFRCDRDFLILLAQLFVHERDGVVARRQALDLVLAVSCR